MTRTDIDDLLREGGAASPSLRAALKAKRGFPAAIRSSARKLVELHKGNRLLNQIINDRGRFFVSLFALDLYFSRHDAGVGLTPGRLKQMCEEQGICSGTRAGALLSVMRLRGYVEALPRGEDRRRRELAPTQKLIGHQMQRWKANLTGAAPLLPAAPRVLDGLERPDVMEALVRLTSAHYRAGFRFIDHAPALRLFIDRNGGMFVLLALLAASPVNVAQTGEAMAISVSQLARAISSSRAHVVKLLKDAECEGYIRRLDSGDVVLLPKLLGDLGEFFALTYLMLVHFGEVAMDHIAEMENKRVQSRALAPAP